MFETFKHIIDVWPGGLSQFATDVGTTPNNAKQMRRNNAVHSKYWPAMIAKAGEYGINGVTSDALVQIEARKNGNSFTIGSNLRQCKVVAA